MLRCEGFGLFVAVCNRPIDRDALIDCLAESMPATPPQRIEVDARSHTPLLDQIESDLPEFADGPLMIVGLENAVPSTEASHPVLHSLNLRRQDWPTKVPRPIVLWVPEYLLTLVGAEAADFLDWRSDTFHFSETDEKGLVAIQDRLWADWDEYMGPPQRLRERIAELESRLAVTPMSDDPALLLARATWERELGDHFIRLANYSRAVDHFRRAVMAFEAINSEPEICRSLNALARALSLGGHLAEARVEMERAIQIVENADDADALSRSNCYANLAMILQDLDELSEARVQMLRAIEIDESTDQISPVVLATHYSNLGVLLQDLGDLSGAKIQIERAIEIDQSMRDPDHPILATRYSNLAVVQRLLGNLSEARKLAERAIQIDEKAYDPEHPRLATRYSNLAMILKDIGDLEGARSYIERAIRICEKALPPGHPMLVKAYSNLAMVLKGLGDYSGARSHMAQAIEIAEIAPATSNLVLANCYSNMADIAFDEGKGLEAISLQKKALEFQLMHLDQEHPDIKSTREQLRRYEIALSVRSDDD